MAATIIIYAGAIVVTFLFVIMLAQQAGLSDADQRSREPFLATVAGFVLLAAVLAVLQRNYDTRPLDHYLNRIEEAAKAPTREDAKKALGDYNAYKDDLRALVLGGGKEDRHRRLLGGNAALKAAFEEAMNDVDVTYHDDTASAKELGEALDKLHRLGLQLRTQSGGVQAGKDLPLSKFSGATSAQDAPLDEQGKPKERLPQDNVAALGRALFSDYLLAVELAGVLLLVATIGAIVIAGRRTEGLR
jgi:NADH-quinone oxidoreductase subunit J